MEPDHGSVWSYHRTWCRTLYTRNRTVAKAAPGGWEKSAATGSIKAGSPQAPAR